MSSFGESDPRPVLRHLAATLAYRAAKTLRDVPPGFATFALTPTARTPVQIVAHMGDLMRWADHLTRGDYIWRPEGGADWETEVARFFEGLSVLDRQLGPDGTFTGSAALLVQGPLADALTHVGQLAMLRGAFGSPVRPESYAKATITAGRVGMDQEAPGREFDGDASARR
jgi:hypothetical protein